VTSISKDDIQDSKTSSWDFGNQILYDLCRDNFEHKKNGRILAKVLFIGRIYAAAVERRKVKDEYISDNFYFEVVGPTLMASDIDERLARLKSYRTLTKNIIPEILATHNSIVKMFNGPTGLKKRSFSSKYLHFHLPNLFFIYDSRAERALRQISRHVPKALKHFKKIPNTDDEYARFFCKCLDMKRQIEQQHNAQISIRQFDNLLINWANRMEVEKRKASKAN